MVEQVTIMGQTYPARDLEQDEIDIFEAEFPVLFGFKDSVEREVFNLRKKNVMAAVMVAVKKFSAKFRGSVASGNEIGWSKLRPEHIGVLVSWTIGAPAGAGWQAIPGWGTAAAPLTVKDESILMFLGLWNSDPNPIIEEWWMHVRDKDPVPPTRMDSINIPDTNEAFVPKKAIPVIFLMEKDTFYARAYFADVVAQTQFGMEGVCVATGTFLKRELIP